MLISLMLQNLIQMDAKSAQFLGFFKLDIN